MEKSNFALRLLPSLFKTAQKVADREDCSLNQFINLALAEKLAVLEDDYWRERKKMGAKLPKSDVLNRLAGNEPPQNGDEVKRSLRNKATPSEAIRNRKAPVRRTAAR